MPSSEMSKPSDTASLRRSSSAVGRGWTEFVQSLDAPRCVGWLTVPWLLVLALLATMPIGILIGSLGPNAQGRHRGHVAGHGPRRDLGDLLPDTTAVGLGEREPASARLGDANWHVVAGVRPHPKTGHVGPRPCGALVCHSINCMARCPLA